MIGLQGYRDKKTRVCDKKLNFFKTENEIRISKQPLYLYKNIDMYKKYGS